MERFNRVKIKSKHQVTNDKVITNIKYQQQMRVKINSKNYTTNCE